MSGWPGRLLHWLWRWLVRKTGGFGLFTILVLQVTLVLVSAGLETVVRGLADAQSRLFFVALFGILVGRAVGSRRTGWFWMLLWMVIGLPAVLLQIASLWSELLLLLQTALLRLFEIAAALSNRTALSTLPPAEMLQLVWSDFSARIWLETVELRAWLVDLFQGSPGFRAGAVRMAWGILLYWLAIWAGMVIRRTQNVIVGLFPAGALLAGILAYARSEHLGMLVLFLMGVLVLYAGETQKNNEQRWDEHRLDYPQDMRLDFSLSSSVLIGAILITAYIVPQINLRSAFRAVLGLDRPQTAASEDSGLAESLGIDRPTPPPSFFEPYEEGGLPRSQLLGSGPELAFTEALYVRVLGPGLGEPARYYWRSLTYEEYTGRGWEAGLIQTVRYGRGQLAPVPDPAYAQPLRQEVRLADAPGGVAYAAGDIVSMDRAFEVAWRVPLVIAYDPFGVRTGADAYLVDSRVPLRLDNLLRTVGTDYPEWVAERYLALPDSLPGQVGSLAREVTRGESNPYDQAIALEQYLRGFTYNLNLPVPPRDRDLVAYFLFDLQQGYCDYYASAMVVMARTLGIPARLAIGYAQGEYDAETGWYVVMALDAHSWPELYFPEFGWVPFEPTAGVEEIDRSSPLNLPPDRPGVSELPPFDDASGWRTALRWLGIALGAGTLGLGLWFSLEGLREGRMPVEVFYRRVFARLYGYRYQFLLPVPVSATPNELATALAVHCARPFRESRLLRRLPGEVEDLFTLTNSYNLVQYAPRRPADDRRYRDARLWRRLRFKLWLSALITRLQRRPADR